MAEPFLLIRDVSKSFPGVRALDRVSLSLSPGEVVAVVGENGAGKSTLMKILAGIYTPDEGTIQLDGQTVHFRGVADALARGLCLIHQELNLAENLSIAANLFLGQERLWAGPFRFLDRGGMRRSARELLARLGLECDPETRVDALSPGQRQVVEIGRALTLQVRVLIMDEPTSSLTQRETDRLYEVIDRLRSEGVTIVYISHRLAEVERLADRAVVLRDGKNAGELPRGEINHANLVRLMVGRELQQFFQRTHPTGEQPFQQKYEIDLRPSGVRPSAPKKPRPRLEVQGVRYAEGPLEDVSFTLAKGEIVGMAGLVGAGRTELSEALFGLRPITAGSVFIDGEPLRIAQPDEAISAGLLLVPEDRRYHGLLLDDTIQRNIGLPNLDRLSFLGLVRRRAEAALARSMCERLSVRTPGVWQTAGVLSGGNQQKVVLAKWLARQPKVLILDEPTRGIDVGAKAEIYALMDRLANEGVAILMISSDLEEILNMSDRVLVMHQGRLAGSLDRNQLSEEAVMNLATGGRAAT